MPGIVVFLSYPFGLLLTFSVRPVFLVGSFSEMSKLGSIRDRAGDDSRKQTFDPRREWDEINVSPELLRFVSYNLYLLSIHHCKTSSKIFRQIAEDPSNSLEICAINRSHPLRGVRNL